MLSWRILSLSTSGTPLPGRGLAFRRVCELSVLLQLGVICVPRVSSSRKVRASCLLETCKARRPSFSDNFQGDPHSCMPKAASESTFRVRRKKKETISTQRSVYPWSWLPVQLSSGSIKTLRENATNAGCPQAVSSSAENLNLSNHRTMVYFGKGESARHCAHCAFRNIK